MPRPKKIKINVSENDEKVEELITKMKEIYPNQAQLIDQIIDTANKTKTKSNTSAIIIADKKGEYYYDDNGCIWNNNFEWVGSYENNKDFYFKDIKKTIKKIKDTNLVKN